MNVQLKKGVMEIVVLSMLQRKDFYGYELVTEISKYIEMSVRTRALISKKVMSRASIRRTTNSVRETASPPLLRTQVSSRVRTDRCSLKNKDCLT